MRSVIKPTLLLIVLSGCTGTQGETYIGMPGSPAWFKTAAPETIAAYYGDRCAAYGFQRSTPEMANCIQREAMAKQNQNAVRTLAAPAYTPPRPTSTTCNRIGDSVYCRSY